MMNRHSVRIVIIMMLALQASASIVRVQRVKGDVRVRRGVEENWSPAGAGMELEDMDTILSGEASEVVLTLEDGTRFTLGGNAILDISDLRRITERQLFLYLMSQKVERLAVPSSPSKIHIVNVSVVRGSEKQTEDPKALPSRTKDWIRETNGAIALFTAEYYTNAIIKCYKILKRYPTINDQGEIHDYLGRSFEALEENGRACDAYQTALKQIPSADASQSVQSRKIRIEEALHRLKSESSF